MCEAARQMHTDAYRNRQRQPQTKTDRDREIQTDTDIDNATEGAAETETGAKMD